MSKLKRILKDLKKKITVFAAVMIVVQPVLGLAPMTAQAFVETYGASVTGLTLVNADTDTDIGPLTNGMIINLESADELNIRANTSPAIVGSVKFGLDANTNYRNETVAPYALAGDTAGNYFVWTPSVGSHTVTATPYSEAGGTGDAGVSLGITFTVVDKPILTEVTPITTPTNNETPSYTFNSTRAGTISYEGDCSSATTSAIAGDNTVVFNTLTDGAHSNCTITVVDGDENVSLPLGVSSFTVDTTDPTFTSSVMPKTAGPGIKTVDITITASEPLKEKPATGILTSQQVHVLGPTYGVVLTITEVDGNPLTVYVPHVLGDQTKFVYTHTIETIAQNKTVPLTVSGEDLASNETNGVVVDGFIINNVVLSPQVTTPTTSVVTAVATVPADEQFGISGSDQGEVKADTTVKADDGNNTENKDEKKEDEKGKKNIPLWGIIFLLILAGIGGYLFYSQGPEKANGKK